MLAVLLCGLLLPVTCIGAASPAAAFGMFGFGRMGGFHGPAPGGGGLWRRMPAPQPGGGRFAGRNPRGGGWPTRHPPIGGGVVGVIGGGGRHGPNSNNSANNGGNPGRGGVPAQTDQSFMPNEIITAFVPNATPQAIDQIARRYELTRIEVAELSIDRLQPLPMAYRRERHGLERDPRARQRKHRRRRAAQLRFHLARGSDQNFRR